MQAEQSARTFKLTVEYDGTAFHGWQRQKRERTVQQTIEEALSRMTREAIVVIGSGRTDAGVHAVAQTASFRTRSRLDADTFFNGLNSLLPGDVVIRACSLMADSFHARFDVRWKHYRYHILNRQLAPAIGRQFVWHIRKPLDVAAMQEAASKLVGRHDFKAFEGAGSPRSHTVRTVNASALQSTGGGNLIYDIKADGFLRFMVRNIVGTLVEVGRNRLSADELDSILASRDRALAGATAPPQGLFLMQVVY